MTLWIWLAVGAQFIEAAVKLLDKYIVSSDGSFPKPFVYAFYTCLFTGGWIVAFLFGAIPIGFIQSLPILSFDNVHTPTLGVISLALVAGYSLFVALVSLFKALRNADASDVVPVVGAVSAASSFLLSFLFLGTRLTPNFVIGVFLLALGTFLVSHLRFNWQTALTSIHSGLFFAIHFVALKGIFNETTFENGFFWSRIGLLIVALSMLLVPRYFKKITAQTKATSKKGGLLVLGAKMLAAVSTLLVLKATELGDVSVVQALGGLQFIFILFFGLFLGRRVPVACGENITCNTDIYHKATFIAIIVLGFFVLFV